MLIPKGISVCFAYKVMDSGVLVAKFCLLGSILLKRRMRFVHPVCTHTLGSDSWPESMNLCAMPLYAQLHLQFLNRQNIVMDGGRSVW